MKLSDHLKLEGTTITKLSQNIVNTSLPNHIEYSIAPNGTICIDSSTEPTCPQSLTMLLKPTPRCMMKCIRTTLYHQCKVKTTTPCLEAQNNTSQLGHIGPTKYVEFAHSRLNYIMLHQDRTAAIYLTSLLFQPLALGLPKTCIHAAYFTETFGLNSPFCLQ